MAKLTALGTLLIVGLLGSVLTVSAASDIAEWSEVNIPAEGRAGGWGLAPGSDIAHLSLAINGTLYAAKLEGATQLLMKSTDEGDSWSETDYDGEAIVDIVCPRGRAHTGAAPAVGGRGGGRYRLPPQQCRDHIPHRRQPCL